LLCHQCGSPVEASDRSCPNCGASLVKTTRFDIATSKGLRISQELKAIKLDDQLFPPGEKISDRYVLGELIGKGPFGEVYKAHDEEIDADVAVKVFAKELIASPIQHEKFGIAGRQARSHSQANLVRVHDSGVHRGHPWVSMQYLEGLSLRKVLGLRRSKGEVFGLDEIEPVITQISLALTHGEREAPCANLKPENIIFMPDLLKVTDTYLLNAFGVDGLRSKLNESTYLAPELHTVGAEADRRADVYSLGVIIGEMAFGADYAPGSAVRDELAGLDILCQRATAFAREERYSSIEALVGDLTALVDNGTLHESSTAPRPPVPPPAPAAPAAPPITARQTATLPAITPPPAPKLAPSEKNKVLPAADEELATVEYSREKEPEIQDLLTTNEVGRIDPKRPQMPRGPAARVNTQTMMTPPAAAKDSEGGRGWMMWAAVSVLIGFVIYQAMKSSPSDEVIQLGSSRAVPPETITPTPQNQPSVVPPIAVAQSATQTANQTAEQITTQTAAQTAAQVAPTVTATQIAAVVAPVEAVGSHVSDTSSKVVEPKDVTVPVEPVKPVEKVAAIGTKCPSGALLVKSKSGNYCVDAYEYPGSGAPPKTRVNWFEATKLCKAAGKRLCALSEWRGACGSKYPYGSSFDADSCNTADEDGFERSLGKAGSNKKCRSRSGAYDMSGNVHEWVEERRIAGGSYESEEDVASCRYSSAKAPGSSSADIGFRCCADPE
jgi:hypothetical protein